MPTSSSAHSGSQDRKIWPTTIAAAAAQTSSQRQPDTGAPSSLRQQPRLGHRGEAERRAAARSPARSPATSAASSSCANSRIKPTDSSTWSAEHGEADHHVALAGDVDQRRFADRRGRRDDFGGQQERQRRGAGDERRPDQAHHRPRPGCQRQRHRQLRRDHPEADLADLLGDRRPCRRRRCCGRSPGPGSGRSWSSAWTAARRRSARRNRCRPPPGGRTGRAPRGRRGASPIRPRRRRPAARCAAPSATASPGAGFQPCGTP